MQQDDYTTEKMLQFAKNGQLTRWHHAMLEQKAQSQQTDPIITQDISEAARIARLLNWRREDTPTVKLPAIRRRRRRHWWQRLFRR